MKYCKAWYCTQWHCASLALNFGVLFVYLCRAQSTSSVGWQFCWKMDTHISESYFLWNTNLFTVWCFLFFEVIHRGPPFPRFFLQHMLAKDLLPQITVMGQETSIWLPSFCFLFTFMTF